MGNTSRYTKSFSCVSALLAACRLAFHQKDERDDGGDPTRVVWPCCPSHAVAVVNHGPREWCCPRRGCDLILLATCLASYILVVFESICKKWRRALIKRV